MYPKYPQIFELPYIGIIMFNRSILIVNIVQGIQSSPQKGLSLNYKKSRYSIVKLKKRWEKNMYPKCTQIVQCILSASWESAGRDFFSWLTNVVRCICTKNTFPKWIFLLRVENLGLLHLFETSLLRDVVCKIGKVWLEMEG